jgi:NADPH-dependent glutamate synthase beta subunit-like oxidoreductase
MRARPPVGSTNTGWPATRWPATSRRPSCDWLLQIGGITLALGWRLADAAQLQALRNVFDAVYLGGGA